MSNPIKPHCRTDKHDKCKNARCICTCHGEGRAIERQGVRAARKRIANAKPTITREDDAKINEKAEERRAEIEAIPIEELYGAGLIARGVCGGCRGTLRRDVCAISGKSDPGHFHERMAIAYSGAEAICCDCKKNGARASTFEPSRRTRRRKEAVAT